MADDYKVHRFTASDGEAYTLRMSPKAHRYSVQKDGEGFWTRLPSVTTVGKSASGFDSSAAMRWQRRKIGDALYSKLNQIVSPGLAEDVLGAADRDRDGSADRGTLVHEWMETFFTVMGQGVACKELGTISSECVAIRDWAAQWKIRPIHVEQIVCNLSDPDNGYAGTLDLVAHYTHPETGEEGVGLFDLKTGRGAYQEYFVQLAAYDAALRWMDDELLPHEGSWFVLHLPEGATEITVHEPKQDPLTNLAAFHASHYLYGYKAAARRG